MAFLSGNDGTVTISTTEIPIRSWEFTQEASEKETTNSTTASNSREYLADRAGVSGSFEAYVDSTTATLTVGGTAVAIELISEEGTTDKAWTGNAVILSKNIINSVAGGDALLVRYGFRVTGALTETQLS